MCAEMAVKLDEQKHILGTTKCRALRLALGKREIRIVQGNMHRRKVANNLLRQIQAEHEVELLLMSEQYEDPDTQTWFPDEIRTAAIWIANHAAVAVKKIGLGDGYVCIRSWGVRYFSCYVIINKSSSAFRTRLGALEDEIWDCTGYVVLGGDFNANMDAKGKAVVEMAARLALIVLK